MKRCIVLAKNGLGKTYPNPLVGSVIVYNGEIIGEGWHKKAGEAHAEVNAINSVKDKNLLAQATIYVNLEPCSHYGKTPPCADLIVKNNIKNVVIGTIDYHSKVHGKGILHLKQNGCNVKVGVMEKECIGLNKRFFTFHQKKRPYIILKWAETKDGFIDRERSKNSVAVQSWISDKYSKQLVHKWRSEEQSILVGTNTVINDNPRLNVREWNGEDPIRLVLDNSLRIPGNSYVFDGTIKTIVFTSSKSLFEKEKENVILEYVDYSKIVPQEICNKLYDEDIQSVLIEGGARVLQSFINFDLWDEARIFIGNTEFNKGLKSPVIEGVIESMVKLDLDLLKTIKPLG